MSSNVRNPVFRDIEEKWRGPVPFMARELGVGLAIGFGLALLTETMFGIGAGVAILGLQVGWRRLDHDRSDYLETFWRRRFTKTRGYNGNTADSEFEPFEPK